MVQRLLKSYTLLLAILLVSACNKVDDNPNFVISINPNYVSIDWENATVISSDDSTGDYQIQFNGEVPDIHPGSVISIDEDTVVHHILVENTSVSGHTMNITSTEAYLTDIFDNCEFVLSTAAGSKSSGRGAVFNPVAAFQLDDKGISQPLDVIFRGKDGTRFTNDLWNYRLDYDGLELLSGEHFRLFMERMNFNFDLDIEMGMNFSGRTARELVNDAIERYRSEALKVDAALIGTTIIEQVIRCNVDGECSYSQGYEIMRHNLFRPLYIKFVVSGVPIVLKLNADLYRQVELSASGQISAYTGFADTTQNRLGFEWSQKEGMKRVSSAQNATGLIPPTAEGKGEIAAKAWLFPRVRVLLDGLVGPSFDIKPYLADTLRGGFREQMLGQDNDYCAWSFDGHAGIDACCGLSLEFLGYEIENFSTRDWNIADWKLFHSPKRVVYAEGAPSLGRTGMVKFMVFDQNYLLGREVLTSLPQIVKFEATGRISSEYGIAHNGIVSVNWMPVENDVLYAKLYDASGRVIYQDTVRVRASGSGGTVDPSITWVDLGLPSGLLWANCNIGATAPEDFGDYFAWGEIWPKSEYTWDTYLYGYETRQWVSSYVGWTVSYHLTKYCNQSNYGENGYSDNYITLLPEDDAAIVNWGDGARMPRADEWTELLNNTTNQWTMRNGVNGRLFTASNGNSIFLPAAGCITTGHQEVNSWCRYWSSTLDLGKPCYAECLSANENDCRISGGDNNWRRARHDGNTIRPVKPGNQSKNHKTR